MMGQSEAAVVAEYEDFRTNGPMTGDERSVLDHWLDLNRDTLILKIAGLDPTLTNSRVAPYRRRL